MPTDDIVTRLRAEANRLRFVVNGTSLLVVSPSLQDEAANEIELLRAEVDSEDGKAYRTLRVMYDNRGREIERLRAEVKAVRGE